MLIGTLLCAACTASAESNTAAKHLDHLEESFRWVEEEPTDVGVKESEITDDRIRIEGSLYGLKLAGSALTDSGSGTESGRKVRKVILTGAKDDFAKMEAALRQQYGEPYDAGDEPYVKVDGGAVHWLRFYDSFGTIRISQASEHDYYIVEYAAGKVIHQE